MAIKFKPIYTCDGCGIDFENENEIRIFTGTVYDGSGTKQYLATEKMYCLKCIPLALDFENSNPQTFKIISKEEKSKTKESCPEIIELKNEIKQINNRLAKINSQNQEFKTFIKKSKIYDDKNLIKLAEDIEKDLDEKMKDVEKYIEDPTQIENEDSIENITEQLNEDEIIQQPEDILTIEDFFKDSGEYEVYCKIEGDIHLNKVMKMCSCKTEDQLNQLVKPNNIKEIYYSIKKYINFEDLNDPLVGPKVETPDKIKIIKQIMFGIPDIIAVDGTILEDFKDYAFIKIDRKDS
jgi:hypothetical protein